MKTSYQTGILAEFIAATILTLKFYRIIERRYKTRVGEIDIIAIRDKTVIFIEVKKRSNKNHLFESITSKQQGRICKAAELFLNRNPVYEGYKKRFDAILITSNLLPNHIKNAW
jgi:putative endonuclease